MQFSALLFQQGIRISFEEVNIEYVKEIIEKTLVILYNNMLRALTKEEVNRTIYSYDLEEDKKSLVSICQKFTFTIIKEVIHLAKEHKIIFSNFLLQLMRIHLYQQWPLEAKLNPITHCKCCDY